MKPVLYLVGLGLTPKYLTRAAEDALRGSDVVFLEHYTVPGSPWTPEKVGEIAGKHPIILSRRDIEDESGAKIFSALEKGLNPALAVIGDPMIATTHAALRLEAVRRGYSVRIIYGVSAHCAAISASGLFAYKFGKSATIVYPRDGIVSEYPYDVLKENAVRGLHTLFYLDVREDGKGMSVGEAVELLLRVEDMRGEGVVSGDTVAIGLARIGFSEEKLVAGRFSELKSCECLPPPPHMLIVPGKMHFIEEEAVRVHMIGGRRGEA